MITAMLLIFSTLRIVNFGNITARLNITRVVILTIAIITISLTINHGKKSVMFVAKNFVTLARIQMMNNRRQKKSGDKTENSVEIKTNTIHF